MNITTPIESDEYVRYHRTIMPEAMDQAEAALVRVKAPIYQNKGRLVQLIRLDAAVSDDGVRRKRGALQVQELNHHRLLEIFIKHVKFATWDARKNKFVRNAPPLEFAKHYSARGQWKLRVLNGIVEAPTLRPDGTVIAKPGYDDATGIYFAPGGVKFPPVPDKPTRKQAREALSLLKDVLNDFPFVPDDEDEPLGAPSASRSVALSAILTAICRKALRTAPAHAFSATTMGTGKSLLCDTVAMIATGREATATSHGKTEEELNKRLFSMLLKGDPVVVIDNIEDPVRSDEFCTVLTAETWQSRILGLSKTGVVPTNVLFLLNGNGLSFEGDIRTRVIMCGQDARMEDPGERTFDRDLRKYVPAERARLAVAALTVLRAFVVAGRSGLDEFPPFGRFEDWSDLVRGALIWLGEPDPCATREAIDAIDPERDKLSALLRAWEAAIGPEKWLTASEIIAATQWTEDFEDEGPNPVMTRLNHADDLETAIKEALSSNFPVARNLGKYLNRYSGRIVDGRSVQVHATRGHSAKYALKIEAMAGDNSPAPYPEVARARRGTTADRPEIEDDGSDW